MRGHLFTIAAVGLACGFARDTPAGASSATRTAGSAAAATVYATNELQFVPRRVIIRQGQTVEWKNASPYVHTVTADPTRATLSTSVELPAGAAPFSSPRLQPGDTYRHAFPVPGTYKYFCVPHEPAKMWGWVVVLKSPREAK